ncbi:MAG: hypothetical protein ACI8UZ_001677 [Akkermansiaceae bacterium]|jgi:hypothetical protein
MRWMCSMERFMKELKERFSRWLNKCHGCHGCHGRRERLGRSATKVDIWVIPRYFRRFCIRLWLF